MDGALVVDNDGVHTWKGVNSSMSFSAGWHSLEIVQIEDGGYSGLTARANGQFVGGSMITASVLEPDTWAMMLLGFVGLGCAAVGRGRKDRIASALD